MPVYETTPLQFHVENNYSAWGGKLLRRCPMVSKENQTKKKVNLCQGGWPIQDRSSMRGFLENAEAKRASRVVAARMANSG